MKQIPKSIFKEMQILGIIKYDKMNKNFAICNKNKKSKKKTYYIQEDVYESYIETIG